MNTLNTILLKVASLPIIATLTIIPANPISDALLKDNAETSAAMPCRPLSNNTILSISKTDNSSNTELLCAHGRTQIAGFILTRHAAQRAVERNISHSAMERAITQGIKYWDPKNRSHVYVHRNISVAVQNRAITTTFHGGKLSRYIRID